MSNQEVQTETTLSLNNQGFMHVTTLASAIQCSELIAKSSFCPKGLAGRPGDVLVCLQMGQELGLKPMQALQNIAVINGRPSLWGDAMLGVCRQSPDFEFIKENYDEKTETAHCVVKRRNEPEFIQSFSKADAIKAKLWGKEGPWTNYPKRMLQMRARGFCLRDSFPDLLRGIIIAEEAEDTPKPKADYSKGVGVIIDHQVAAEVIVDEFQLEQLRERMKEADSNEIDICHHLKIDCLEAMTVNSWQGVMRLLERKLSKKKKSADLEINDIYDDKNWEGKNVEESSKEFFGEGE